MLISTQVFYLCIIFLMSGTNASLMILWMSNRHGAATEEILQCREVVKRTAGARGKTDRAVDDHSQYKCCCKTPQNFLWSDCFQVQHFSTLRCQSAVSHAAQAFTGLDKASLVCEGVRQKEWEGHFLFYFKPSFAEARSGHWLPASSGTGLISQFRENFATQHSFLTQASAQHVCRCTLYLFHTRFLSV